MHRRDYIYGFISICIHFFLKSFKSQQLDICFLITFLLNSDFSLCVLRFFVTNQTDVQFWCRYVPICCLTFLNNIMFGKHKEENMVEFKLYFMKIKPEAFYKPEIEKIKLKSCICYIYQKITFNKKKSCCNLYKKDSDKHIFGVNTNGSLNFLLLENKKK